MSQQLCSQWQSNKILNAIFNATPATKLLTTLVAFYVGYKIIYSINSQGNDLLVSRKAQQQQQQSSSLLRDDTPHSILRSNEQFVHVNGKRLRIVYIPHELGSKV